MPYSIPSIVDYDDDNGQDPCKLNATYEIKDGQDCEYDEDENGIIQCENERNATCIFYKYGPTREATYFQVYNLFGFFWGLFFLEALDQMVLAGAFASWYYLLHYYFKISQFYRQFCKSMHLVILYHGHKKKLCILFS